MHFVFSLVWFLTAAAIVVMAIRAVRLGGEDRSIAVVAATILYGFVWYLSDSDAHMREMMARERQAVESAESESAADAADAIDATKRHAKAMIASAESRAGLARIRAAMADHKSHSAETYASELQGKLHDLERKLAVRRPMASCRLSSADARGLRGIASGSGVQASQAAR